MTDWPASVREYEEVRHRVGTFGVLVSDVEAADAAIRDLKDGWKARDATIIALRGKLDMEQKHYIADFDRVCEEKQQAEAEVMDLKVKLADLQCTMDAFQRTQRQDYIVQKLKQAEAEVARLKWRDAEHLKDLAFWQAEVARLKWMLRLAARMYLQYGTTGDPWDIDKETDEWLADLERRWAQRQNSAENDVDRPDNTL